MVFGAVILAFWCASAAVLLGQSCQGLPGATTSVTTVPYMVFLAWSSGHVNTDAVIPRQLCYRRSSPRQRYTAWLDPQRTHVKKYFPKKERAATNPRLRTKSSRRGKFRSARYIFVWFFLTSFFKITFQMMLQQKYTWQIWMGVVEYSLSGYTRISVTFWQFLCHFLLQKKCPLVKFFYLLRLLGPWTKMFLLIFTSQSICNFLAKFSNFLTIFGHICLFSPIL